MIVLPTDGADAPGSQPMELMLQDAPADAYMSTLITFHDGNILRLVVKNSNDPTELLQFGYDPKTGKYVFGYRSRPRVRITNPPRDIDWNSWKVVYDGEHYCLFHQQTGKDKYYQAVFDGREYRFLPYQKFLN